MTESKPKSIRELRRFGITMSAPLAVLGSLALWRGKPVAPYLLAMAAAFLVTVVIYPRALWPIERAWMKLADVLSAVMTRVVLFVCFYLVITPFGLLMRLLGKDLLDRKFDPNLKSYWVPVDPNGPCSRFDKPY